MEIAEGIWTVENFLTKQECQEWIDFAESIGFEDAPISVGQGKEMIMKDVRNNNRAMVDDFDKAHQLWEISKEHIPKIMFQRVALGLNERLRFYRYDSTQKFSWHYDGYYKRDNGEQSLLTYMVYLNEEFEGGETVFRDFTTTEIVPRTGMLLLFEHKKLHEGSVIRSGRKYVLRTDVMYSP